MFGTGIVHFIVNSPSVLQRCFQRTALQSRRAQRVRAGSERELRCVEDENVVHVRTAFLLVSPARVRCVHNQSCMCSSKASSTRRPQPHRQSWHPDQGARGGNNLSSNSIKLHCSCIVRQQRASICQLGGFEDQNITPCQHAQTARHEPD